MNILVTYATRHGSTEEIAREIGAVLSAQQHNVEVLPMDAVATVLPYDAFVLGSAVYLGGWLREARLFAAEHAEILALRPTWLFSSGPIGKPPNAAAEGTFDAADLLATTHAREHRLFGGKLEKESLGIGERVLVGALRVPEGDYREWGTVAAWATAIGRTLDGSAG